MTDDLSDSLAATLRAARLASDLSISALAEQSGVSRAMIGKVERGEAQPTAVLLGRLSGPLGMTLSELIARAEGGAAERLVRATDQPTWTDPGSGYRRRSVSPPGQWPLELIEVELPAHAELAYPADSYAFISQQIWLLAGQLHFREGDVDHELEVGDCLQLGPPAPCVFINATDAPCRYLVALAKRTS